MKPPQPTLVRRYHGVLPLLLLAACGSSGAAGSATGAGAHPGEAVAPAGHETLAFSANATAPTEEQAYALARQRLLEALLAAPSPLPAGALGERLATAVHVQASEPLRFSRVDGGVQAEVGLGRENLRAVFSRLDAVLANSPEPSTANPLAAAIHAVRLAGLRRASCLRRRQLESGACEPADTAAELRRLEAILAGVRLRGVYAGGIPMKDRAWLRPIAVMAILVDAGGERPLPDLPLRIQASDRSPPTMVRTDAGGTATRPIAKDTPASTTWTVTLDVEEMIGPFAKLAAPVSTTLQGRPTGLARSALAYPQGKPPAVETGRALLAALSGTITEPIALAAAEARQLSEAGTEKMKDVAPEVAEQLHGALDTILLLDVESEFASRMGTQRVWYEARGTLRVFAAWTGELVAEVTASATEAELGEERAERAARESLGRELAENLKRKLPSALHPMNRL